MRRLRSADAGFTLLEVLVAIAILGLGLTVVLSAQTGVFWSYARATHLSQAPGLARCKMAELEMKLLNEGYPFLDEKDEGDCCEDVDQDRYTCSWEILRVKLPNLPLGGDFGGDAGAPDPDLAGSGGAGVDDDGPDLGSVSSSGPGGPLTALMDIKNSGGAVLGSNPSVGGLAQMMAPSGSGQSAGMVGMVMGMVYPDLKPMLEGSIRKLIVRVAWKEGKFDRDLEVMQYVTNPQQGGFNPMDEAIDDAMSQAAQGQTPSQGQSQTPSSSQSQGMSK